MSNVVKISTPIDRDLKQYWKCDILGSYKVNGEPYSPIQVAFNHHVPFWYRLKTKLLLGARWEKGDE